MNSILSDVGTFQKFDCCTIETFQEQWIWTFVLFQKENMISKIIFILYFKELGQCQFYFALLKPAIVYLHAITLCLILLELIQHTESITNEYSIIQGVPERVGIFEGI